MLFRSASTDEILQTAAKLGEMLATHPAAKKLEDVVRRLEADTAAQRVMADLNRTMQKLQEKEMTGQPIEVAEKRQLDELQTAVIRNATLRDFQMAQMEYADLMRRVDEAMYGQQGGAGGGGDAGPGIVTAPSGAGASPIINPDVIRGARG